MAKILLVCILCSAFLTLGDCAVSIDVTPSVINIGHTDSLEVTCSVQKGDFPNILFSITLSHSHSADDPKFTYLASVNSCDGKVRKISSESKTASGVINNSGDSHLKLTWTRPTFKKSGVYKCDVIAMDAPGKPVAISTLASVGASNDDMDAFVEMFDNFTDLYDLSIRTLKCACENKSQEMNAIRSDTLKLERSLNQLDVELNDKYQHLNKELNVSVLNLRSSLNRAEENFSTQLNEIHTLYNELHSTVKINENRVNLSVNDLLDKQRGLLSELNEVNRNASESYGLLAKNMATLTQTINGAKQQSESYQKDQTSSNAALQNEINTLRSHQANMFKMETGSFSCGQYAKNFPIATDGGAGRAEDTVITFKSAFPRPPKIILTAIGWDLDSSTNLRLGLQRLNVTATGFVGRCGTWANTVIYIVNVEWTAMSTPSD